MGKDLELDGWLAKRQAGFSYISYVTLASTPEILISLVRIEPTLSLGDHNVVLEEYHYQSSRIVGGILPNYGPSGYEGSFVWLDFMYQGSNDEYKNC